jgi:N-acetylneuraminic acid mutarotase
MPTAGADIDSAVVDGKIYVFGGYSGGNVLSTVEVYDPATDKWEKKADMKVGRTLYSAEVVNGKVYFIGGWDAAEVPLAAVLEYDPAPDIWSKKADMPAPRYELATSVVNGKIYAIGGFGGGEEVGVATVEEYTPEGWPFAVSPQGKLVTTWGEIKRR